jgi:hypothetical protein
MSGSHDLVEHIGARGWESSYARSREQRFRMPWAVGLAIAEPEAPRSELKHGRDVERVASSTPQNVPWENINMVDSSTQHTINNCNDF